MSSRENDNIQLVRGALNTLNAGDTTNVSEFISPAYFKMPFPIYIMKNWKA
jgi:hypothetical protein